MKRNIVYSIATIAFLAFNAGTAERAMAQPLVPLPPHFLVLQC